MRINAKYTPCFLALLLWAAASIVAQDVRQNPSLQSTVESSQTVSINQINNIARQLISPCCWKQTVDVHPSESSDKIKAEIEAALMAGQTEEEIINRFVAEYGERILAIPKATGFNWMLWILPALFLVTGSMVVVIILRHISHLRAGVKVSRSLPIDAADLKRIERELEELDA